MFGLENSANNFGASAGLLANTLANRPVQAALGTLFVSTDTLLLYRWTGLAWVEISGGAVYGAFNGITQFGTLFGLGGGLVQNTQIYTDAYPIEFIAGGTNTPQFKVINNAGIGELAVFSSIAGFNDGGVYIGNFETRGTIQAKEYGSQAVSELRLNYDGGDVTIGNVGGSQIIFYQFSSTLSTNLNGVPKGIFLEGITNIYYFGDRYYTNNGTYIRIDDNNQLIDFFNKGSTEGLELNYAFRTYRIGDFNNNTYQIGVDDIAQQLFFNGSNLVSGSASGFSGDYLEVWVNGTQYKIKLDNP